MYYYHKGKARWRNDVQSMRDDARAEDVILFTAKREWRSRMIPIGYFPIVTTLIGIWHLQL